MGNSQKLLQIICYFIKRDSKKSEEIQDNDSNKGPLIVIQIALFRVCKQKRHERIANQPFQFLNSMPAIFLLFSLLNANHIWEQCQSV